MIPTANIKARNSEPAINWLQTRHSWLGLLILCALVLILSACQPGESGDGVMSEAIERRLAVAIWASDSGGGKLRRWAVVPRNELHVESLHNVASVCHKSLR